MKTIPFYTAILIFVFTTITYSQFANKDQVHLLNKEKYTGTVIEQKPGEYISLLSENGKDTLTFQMEEIDKIVKIIKTDSIISGSKRECNVNCNEMEIKPNKIFNDRFFSPIIHYGAGGGDIAFNMLGLAMFMKLTPETKVGVSACYYGETGSLRNRPIQWQKVPLTVEIMHDVQHYFYGRSALVASLGVGYSFTLNGNYTDLEKRLPAKQTNGVVINPGLGYRFNVLKNTGFMVDVRYQLIIDKDVNKLNETLKENNWDNIVLRGSLFF